ncbi:MAG TPA: putative LPS assembly protein LptD [Longimicrobiales bacterium]
MKLFVDAGRFRNALMCAVLHALLLLPSAASAQERPDTAARPVSAQILDRLRGLRPLGAPDSVVSEDSVRAKPQEVRAAGLGDNPDRGRQDVSPLGGVRPGSAPGTTRDSVWDALLRLGGLVGTEYSGDSARYSADSSGFSLRGSQAMVNREGQQITADLINYSGTSSLWCGYGKPRISGVGESALESDSLCYNVDERSAVARGATTTISEGAVWRMYSTTLRARGDRYYSHEVMFTDCDQPWDHVHYAFVAKEALAVRNNVLVARNVTLRFRDVPVMWLPFMVQSLSQGRRSGVLMPRFGINDIARTSSRYNRRIEDIGFYWAMNDYMGSEIAMDWMSDNYTALRASYDYNFLRQFLRGGITARRYWKSEGGRELTIASQNSWEPNERTRLNANANYSTSSEFVRERSFDPRELNRSIDSNFSMSRRLDWGSLSLGASRRQFLSDETVSSVLPNASLNLSSITLFKALPGEEHWYSNATLTAGGEVTRDATSIEDSNPNPSAQSRQQFRGSARSSFSLGNLQVSQSFSTSDTHLDFRPVVLSDRDTTIELPESSERRNSWDVTVGYRQQLIGTTTLTPRIRLNGESINNLRTDEKTVASPMSLDFGADLQSNIYGLWGGIGPFERLRHRISPSISYSYAPKPSADSLQLVVFSGLDNIRERNRISIGLSQTFEGKVREELDSAALARQQAVSDTATGPTRRAGSRTIMLLSIATDAVAYDFVRARETGDGIETASIGNILQSDLIRGLQLRFTHDLFRTAPLPEGAPPGTVADRTFAPHLSKVSANMSVNSGSWLFRKLGLGRTDSVTTRPGDIGSPETPPAEGGVAVDRTREEFGMVGTRRNTAVGAPAGQTGSWTASLDYTLIRPRNDGAAAVGAFGTQEDQRIGGNLTFYPTENWTAQWRSNYSLTTGGFTDQFLTLTRRLHDWDANFDFVKAQNGNFSFQFRVNLRANPDVKLDYSQNDFSNGGAPSRFR